MSGHISVPCPHCQQKLKIKDVRLLGRTVSCPKCHKPVALQIPQVAPVLPVDEVKLELVDDATPVGTSPKWIPDNPVLDLPPRSTPEPSPASPGDFPNLAFAPTLTTEPTSVAASQYLKKRRKKPQRTTLIVGGLLGLAGLAVVGVLVNMSLTAKPKPDPSTGAADLAAAPGSPPKPYSVAELEGSVQKIQEFKPTAGKPIELFMVPSGVSVVFHLRPAQLWSSEYEDQVLRSSLTSDVTGWIESTIQSLTNRRPDQIEELLVGLIVGARGTKPDVCLVMHLKTPEQLADLVQEFKGTYLHEEPIPRIKVNETHAYLIHDEKTIAICPAQYAGELEDWIKTPNPEVPEGVTQLLKLTDRDRLFTIVGQVGDLRNHLESIFPEPSRMPVSLVSDWLGEESETVCWSIHTKPYLHSELHVRPGSTSDTQALKETLLAQFNSAPERVWKEACERMNPQELRFRKMVGRFPAMLEAFRQATVSFTSYRQVSLTTVLPAKAVPNLALATMFTINEASRTNFEESGTPRSAPSSPTLPATVAERLKLPVDVEFSRTPLEQACAYLCEKIEVNLFVDGDALKDAGYTKNMQQTFTLGKVPVEKAFAEIIGRYQEVNGKMVVWIDESTRTVHVTTEKFALRDGRTILKLLPE